MGGLGPRTLYGYSDICVFLFGAICLVVPSGYSLGAALLMLSGLGLLLLRKNEWLGKELVVLSCVLVAYSIYWMLRSVLDGQGTSGLDKPSRFLLAVPALIWVVTYPPRVAFVWAGFAVGAIGAGGWAMWQKVVEEAPRASGYTHVIQFGNLSMLLGLLSLGGLFWAVSQKNKRTWIILLAAGAVFGIFGSLMSGSRGGWLAAPLCFLVLCFAGKSLLSRRLLLWYLMVVIGFMVLLVFVPKFGVVDRIGEAYVDVHDYMTGEKLTGSIGARFEMWKGAWTLFSERSLVGWGDDGYKTGMNQLVLDGEVIPYVNKYGHPHNEYLNSLSKGGVFGFLLLVTLYFSFLVFFAKRLGSDSFTIKSLAVAGTTVVVSYMSFGASQTFLAHNSGVMFYAFSVAIISGCIVAEERIRSKCS